VLPFRNSGEPGSEFVVDSVTAGLIRQLAVIEGLQVKSEMSSFMLKDKLRDKPDLADVAARLGVNHVIEGDAKLTGGRLVVHASLVRAADNTLLQTHLVDRQISSEGDIVSVVEDLTRTMVNELRLKLGRTQRRYGTDLATLNKYLRARSLRDTRVSQAREAIALFQDVIRADPSFAPAQAALAATYGYLSLYYPDAERNYLPPREGVALMTPLVAKALETDPTLAEAHAAMGFIHAIERRWADAEVSFRHAIDLEPGLSALYGDFVLSVLVPWGRLTDALSWLERARLADPLSLDLLRITAAVQISAGRYDEALVNCQRVLDEQPDFPAVPLFKARAQLFGGRRAEALEWFDTFSVGRPGVLGWIHAINGRRPEAEAIAAEFAHLPPRQAEIYGLLGDNDRAFEALDRLAALNPIRAGYVLRQPELASLRSDPRFAAFHRKLGFPR
jgi:adenylate cyclase